MPEKSENRFTVAAVSIVAIVFGLLTLKSGGAVLFIDGEDRLAAGNYVPFVLWFNFIAGFFYIIAGAGLWQRRQWAVKLSFLIVLATLIVYVLLGLHILSGGLYETRTVIAMSLRSVIWVFIAAFAYWKIKA